MEHIRINADYPEVARNVADNKRLSDHDALVAYFRIAGLGTVPTSCTLQSTTAAPIVGVPVSYTVQLTPAAAIGSVTVNAGAGESCTAAVAAGAAICTITYASAGVRTINANFTGTAPFLNSACGPLTQTIGTVGSTILLQSSINPSRVGQLVMLAATVSGSNPTGNVNFTSGGVTFATSILLGTGNTKQAFFGFTPPVGSSNLVGRYVGDANNSASDSPVLVQVVLPGATSTTISASPANGNALEPVTLTALVTVQAPAVGPATGEVIFFVDGGEVGRAQLQNGVATLRLGSVGIGSRRYSASYSGSGSFSGSSSAVLLGQISVQQIPTQTGIGLALLTLLLMGFGVFAARRNFN